MIIVKFNTHIYSHCVWLCITMVWMTHPDHVGCTVAIKPGASM